MWYAQLLKNKGSLSDCILFLGWNLEWGVMPFSPLPNKIYGNEYFFLNSDFVKLFLFVWLVDFFKGIILVWG